MGTLCVGELRSGIASRVEPLSLSLHPLGIPEHKLQLRCPARMLPSCIIDVVIRDEREREWMKILS